MYQLSFHFLEIRLRVFYLLVSLILTLLTSYYYQMEFLYLIGRPFLYLNHKFILIDLTEALYTIIRLSIIVSVFFIVPFGIYNFWCFYIPGRYIFERKIINLVVFIFFFFLFLEILSLYFIIFPKLCEFLLSFEINPSKVLTSNNEVTTLSTDKVYPFVEQVETELTTTPSKLEILKENRKNINEFWFNDIKNQIQIESGKKIPVVIELTARLESYVKLSTRFYFITLVLFQVPFIFSVLFYYSVLDCYHLSKFRKFFLLSSLLISAFLSPPDIISQLIIAFLLFFFYEFLIFLGIFYLLLKKKS